MVTLHNYRWLHWEPLTGAEPKGKGSGRLNRYDSFVLRVWRRDGADVEQWSGQLEHLQGRSVWRFSDPKAMLALLYEAITGASGPGADAEAPEDPIGNVHEQHVPAADGGATPA